VLHQREESSDLPKSDTFEELYKPCILTMAQLLREAPTRNQAILAACKSSDTGVAQQLLKEIQEEVRLGWEVGPWTAVPDGCVVSRRFPLVQNRRRE
jgi:hypothetical protein